MICRATRGSAAGTPDAACGAIPLARRGLAPTRTTIGSGPRTARTAAATVEKIVHRIRASAATAVATEAAFGGEQATTTRAASAWVSAGPSGSAGRTSRARSSSCSSGGAPPTGTDGRAAGAARDARASAATRVATAAPTTGCAPRSRSRATARHTGIAAEAARRVAASGDQKYRQEEWRPPPTLTEHQR